MAAQIEVDQSAIAAFISKWQHTPGGAERANYQLFLTGLCHALQLEEPDVGAKGVLGRYQFEGPVPGGSLKGGTGFIDFYRKGSFILEAKQSQIPEADKNQPELFDPAQSAPGAKSGAKYDQLMRKALKQARNYAVNLPSDHPWPPFLLVCDVGRAFELYFDYSGNGRGYDFYPDRQGYRIGLEQLAEPEVQELFRDIWDQPKARDPKLRAAEVTRGVARRLADVSKWLEEGQRIRTSEASDYDRSLAIEETSLFLMRILFCMFAEDVGLLPKESFKRFLEEAVAVEDDQHFQSGLQNLWELMSDGTRQPRWSWALKSEVRFFNGGLFEDAKTFVLGNADRGELLEAARTDWSLVEPAIFGTLLEQALTPSERSKLGAHYTPRPYVERLVRATIMDVLEAEWETVQAEAEALCVDGNEGAALETVLAFHERLSGLRILDPACGTGNFLYVAMELLLRLEADVLVLVEQLGGEAEPRVGPRQFYGLELNPRAAVIAELVLWIGWLRWRMSNDPEEVPEPVLDKTNTINFGGHAGYDAVLKQNPTGEPDLENPMVPDWPEADFIVGNPPFIGKGAAMRGALGSDYCVALWEANPNVPRSADFVMQWWDRAATLLLASGSPLVRFGFVTTNSITGSFNRRVISQYQSVEGGLSVLYAIPDHPWYKASRDAAAVRIAMTVAGRGRLEGDLFEVVEERKLDTDQPEVALIKTSGVVNSDLTVGADATNLKPLAANRGLSYNGMMLAGQGFKITKKVADHLIRQDGKEAVEIIRPYLGGSDLLRRPAETFVIDFTEFSEKEARQSYPTCYQVLLENVYPSRAKNRDRHLREKWWLFGRVRGELRDGLKGLSRYIATTETSRYRVFQFLPGAVVPDHMIVAIASDDAMTLGVLQSRIHLEWALHTGAWLGVGNDSRYSKSKVFDPFPFPSATPSQQASIRDLGEEIDETRKIALSEVERLTMTELYHLRDAVRRGDDMDLVQKARAEAARASIIGQLHDQLDIAVAEAYGWRVDLPTSEIVSRLVALNAERVKDEEEGEVQWLRPAYQRPRFYPDGDE